MPTLFLILLSSFALLLKGDEKLLKQVEQQVVNHDFDKADALLNKISAEGRLTVRYFQYAALISDSLHEYVKAETFYGELQKAEPGSLVYGERITWLKAEKIKSDEAELIRIEKIKNCLKCKGTGYYEVTGTCDKCNGFKKLSKDCSTCHGRGLMTCNSCEGSGKIQARSGDKSVSTESCGRCYGRGTLACTAMCNNGKVMEDCRKCQATGMITAKVKCDLH